MPIQRDKISNKIYIILKKARLARIKDENKKILGIIKELDKDSTKVKESREAHVLQKT